MKQHKQLRYKIQLITETGKIGATKIFLDGHICEIIFIFGVFLVNGERIDTTGARSPMTLNFPPVFDANGTMIPYHQEIYLECVAVGATTPQIIVKQIYQD
jgi:hypothetical protein